MIDDRDTLRPTQGERAKEAVPPVYKYIEFIKVEQKPKTSVWECLNKAVGIPLGTIAWYGPWRQYCFCPEAECVFSSGCLADIQHFMGWLRENKL